jgi:hypothetical protein
MMSSVAKHSMPGPIVTAVGRMLTPKGEEPRAWERIRVRQYDDGTYTAERYWLVPADDNTPGQ